MFAIFLTVFIDIMGFGMVIPLLPLYGKVVGATPWQIGILMASFSAAQFFTAPMWGWISDQFGRKPILLAGLAGSATCYFLMGFANSYWQLLVLRSLTGVMAGNMGAAFAYVADVTTPESRAKGMGTVGAAFGLGFIGGPAIGGILVGGGTSVSDFHLPALVAGALSSGALIVGALTLKAIRPQGRSTGIPTLGRLWSSLHNHALHMPLTGIFVSTFAFAGMEATAALWAAAALNFGAREISFMFATMGFASAMVQGGLIHRLTKTIGLWKTVILGTWLLAAGMVAMPFAHSIAALAFPTLAMAVGFGMLSPGLNTALSLAVTSDVMGATMGTGRALSTASRALGPAVAGALYGAVGRNAPFFLGAALLAGLAALLGQRTRASRA